LIGKLRYYYTLILSGLLTIPFSIYSKKSVKISFFTLFVRILPKNMVITYRGSKFIARKGKTDIMILNKASEPWMDQKFKLRPGDVFIDIGAHVGKYSLTAARMVGDSGKVIAIEAHPGNFHALLENIELNDYRNIIPLNLAASNKDGDEVWLRLRNPNDHFDFNYSLKSEGWEKNESGAKVRTKTIDSIINDLGISKIDWVKIDVEGAEDLVIDGMKNTIGQSDNICLQIELEEANAEKVDGALKGFKKELLGGDDPKVQVFLYSR
jgi:FkbM family methyltransferase